MNRGNEAARRDEDEVRRLGETLLKYGVREIRLDGADRPQETPSPEKGELHRTGQGQGPQPGAEGAGRGRPDDREELDRQGRPIPRRAARAAVHAELGRPRPEGPRDGTGRGAGA